MPFSETSSYCQSLGGTQVFISLSYEFTFMKTFTQGLFAQPWLSITRDPTDNKWYNPDGTTPFISWWSTGEPSLNGDCATFKSTDPQGMKATPCWSIQPAMCKQMPAICPDPKKIYGGQYTRSGNITSPGYPVQYYNNLDCLYTITSPNKTYITLTFNPYLVEGYVDYVLIYDGPDTTYPSLGSTSSALKLEYESTNNSVTLKFHTDRSITNKGWLLKWNAKSNTPPVIQSGNGGNFTSPNYPNDYDSYTEQMFYLTVADGFQVNVTIDDFLTENRFDVLEVYDNYTIPGVNMIANLTGDSIAPWNWLSQSSHVTMRFRTDGSVQKRGFHGYWTIQ